MRRGRPAIEEVHCVGCGELAEAAFWAHFTRSGTHFSPCACGIPTALSVCGALPSSVDPWAGVVLK